MKKVLGFGILVALAICGCQVREEGELAPEGKVFTATTEAYIADGSETKTSMDSEGNVIWKAGDQVSIFAGSTVNEHYQVTDASDGKTAAALNRVYSPGFVAGGEINNNVAFYPYAETAEIAKSGSAYVIRDIVLPEIQNYAQASFGNGAFPMAAVTSSTRDMVLKFKNVLGGLKLQLKGTATIASICITGNNNEMLCGAAAVTVSNENVPTISMTDASAKTVTLNCGDGVQLNETTATAFIIALPPMTMSNGFTVTVTDTGGAKMEIKTTKSQTITRSNLLSMPAVTYEGTATAPEHQFVDLGLPSGLKWATCNVGATAPEEYGDYFAWGATKPYYESQDPLVWKAGKEYGYTWPTCPFRTSGNSYSNITFSKYNTSSSYGIIENSTVLDPEDDAASVNWGGSWRMPTDAEWSELRTECSWTWTSQNGISGRLVTGPNGNSIFLPAAGDRYDAYLNNAGSVGYYWSSSLYTDRPLHALYVSFHLDGVYRNYGYRYYGQSVRPVTDEGVRVFATGITLDKPALTLAATETATIIATVAPSNATQNSVIWSSSNTAVATVSWEGVVTAVSIGSATITATTHDGGFTATCTVTVKAAPTAVAVDLGLTSGLKWATCNVGATAPEEYGDYFAWGETEPYYSNQKPLTWKDGKTGYNWASYKFELGTDYNGPFSKYVTKVSYGTIDNKTVLDLEDDAASVNWGSTWRMPTDAEWTELETECTWIWTTQNGVNGQLVTGPNGNSIFLPAAGSRFDTDSYINGTGRYWSSSLFTGSPYGAWSLCFNLDDVYRYSYIARCYGQSVRSVSDEGVRVSVTHISLNQNSITLTEGGTSSFTVTVRPSNATQPAVIWSSSNTSVATVDYAGVVTAMSEGSATITATTYDGGFTATCSVTVSKPTTGTEIGYEWVDLGLTSGLKWATCNVGASSPEEYGDYFAWGEIEPYYTEGHSQDNPCSNWKANKTGYNMASYKWSNGSSSTYTKYNNNSSYGSVDNKYVLDLDDDAAHVKWGGTWRMPTDVDWTGLRTECTWTWTNQNGVYGRLVTGPNGNSIFLPAAGYRGDTSLDNTGSNGSYWSSSLTTDYTSPMCAYDVGFDSDDIGRYRSGRKFGFPVRPVTE